MAGAAAVGAVGAVCWSPGRFVGIGIVEGGIWIMEGCGMACIAMPGIACGIACCGMACCGMGCCGMGCHMVVIGTPGAIIPMGAPHMPGTLPRGAVAPGAPKVKPEGKPGVPAPQIALFSALV